MLPFIVANQFAMKMALDLLIPRRQGAGVGVMRDDVNPKLGYLGCRERCQCGLVLMCRPGTIEARVINLTGNQVFAAAGPLDMHDAFGADSVSFS